jgi:lipoprotein-anchoring transpeptidase ErfK/SrfK
VYLKDPADGQMLYIRSFPVGLGTDDSTPLGKWVIRPRSKVVNPGWTNPRTNETFSRDDPRNPVGEFWMGLEGVTADTADLSGYGIHGTIDQNSIGTQSSMGCIRLRDEDISQVFYMFWEGETTVQIVK